MFGTKGRQGLAFIVALMLLASCDSEKTALRRLPDVLTLAHEGPVLSMDPQSYNDSVTWSFQGNVYDPLVTFDAEMKIRSALADRWENPNDLTWRFYLRKNVRFHNGRPFTAADVVYTITRGLLTTSPGTKPYLISVKSATRINDWTIDVTTDRPNPVLLNKLTFLYILPADEHMEATIEKPIGTGPYRFLNKIGSQRISLEGNDSYWGGKPAIKKVDFVTFADPDNQGVEALLAGKVHLLRDFSESLIPRIQKDSALELRTHDGLGVTFLGLNVTGSAKQNPLVDLNVRKAVYSALDNAALVKSTLDGNGTVATQLISPTVFGYDPGYHAPLQGVDRAKELLREAGYPDGLETTGVFGNDEIRVRRVAEQLQRADIRAQGQFLEWKDLNDKMLAHQLPMVTLGWTCSYGDAGDFLENCAHTYDPKTGYGSYNVAGYSNPDVDRLIEQSGETLKVNERKEQLQQAFSILMSDLPYIPLFCRYRHYGVSSLIEWTPRKDGRLYAFDIRWKEQQ